MVSFSTNHSPMLPHGIGNVCAVVAGDGGKGMGGRGPASIGLSGRSAASALLCSQAKKPCRHLRWADATLQHYRPCSPLPRANISPLCKSTKTCHLTRGSNATPRSIHHNQHITLRSTKHSLYSGWVRCYILPWCASVQTSPGVFSVIIFKTNDLAPNLQFSGFAHIPLG